MAAYRWVYDSRDLQADCQEPGSAPEPYAWQSSMGYLLGVLCMMCTCEVWRRRWLSRWRPKWWTSRNRSQTSSQWMQQLRAVCWRMMRYLSGWFAQLASRNRMSSADIYYLIVQNVIMFVCHYVQLLFNYTANARMLAAHFCVLSRVCWLHSVQIISYYKYMYDINIVIFIKLFFKRTCKVTVHLSCSQNKSIFTSGSIECNWWCTE